MQPKEADKTRLPLMYLHAEDLGTESSRVGLRLSRALDLPIEWNAIVLLDGIYRLCHQSLKALTTVDRSGYFSRAKIARFCSP